MVVQRGFRRPPSYHIDRLRAAPAGHVVDVMTNGFGAMPDFADRIDARDRWAIAAYIRALQLSEHATIADVPANERGSRSSNEPAADRRRADSRSRGLQRPLLAAGARAARVAVGGLFNPTQFFQSYLMAYMFCLGTTLGCLALGMVHQLSGGAWGVVLRRPIGAAVARPADPDACCFCRSCSDEPPLHLDAR